MLAEDVEAEVVGITQRHRVRISESSVKHAEIFQADGIGSFILGQSRPLPTEPTRPHQSPPNRPETHTPNREEPGNCGNSGHK